MISHPTIRDVDFSTMTEDTAFVTTRPVRGALHELGTIEAGERVMFRRQEPQDGAGFVLAYLSGEPTNGNQYLVLADWKSVRAFAESAGLAIVHD